MRFTYVFGLMVVFGTAEAWAQPSEKLDEQFVHAKPAVGELIPGLTVYTMEGSEFKTSSLRGHYTVLTFGCLT